MSSAAPKLLPETSDEDLPFAPTPALDWYNAHVLELQRYKGQHVAIDPRRGVVAAGAFDEVCDALEAINDGPDSDVTVFVVR